MHGFDRGKPVLGKRSHDAGIGRDQGCRAEASVPEFREKLDSRLVNARFMGGAFLQTGWLMAKQIRGRSHKFVEIFVTQRFGVSVRNLRQISRAAKVICDREGKRVCKELFVRGPFERFNAF
jgi:hypothetical protein